MNYQPARPSGPLAIAPAATESAVLVPVPEAERVVSRHRARLDAAATLGVPAHVTVPYRGAHADVVPHLTVGDRPAGGVADLRAAEAEVLPALPVAARVSRAWLMTGADAPDSWRAVAELPLAATTGD